MNAPARMLHALACTALLLHTAQAGASQCWRELGFVASNGWLGASSVMRYEGSSRAELVAAPEGEPLVAHTDPISRIHVEFSAMRSTGTLDLWFDPQSGAALQGLRTSHGKQSRQKMYRFLQDGVWRERREPAGTKTRALPKQWIMRSSARIAYPIAPPEGEVVIAPAMLIGKAAALVSASREGGSTHLVFTDTQLYRVQLRAAAAQFLPAKYTLRQGSRTTSINGKREVRRVALHAELLGAEPEEEAFTLLELGGDLAIYIDTANGMPVRIEGSLMPLGVVPVALERAVLAERCTD